MAATLVHEALVGLLRERVELVPALIGRVLARALPRFVVLRATGGAPVLCAVVEVQLARDERRRWSWPLSVAAGIGRFHLRARVAERQPLPGQRAWWPLVERSATVALPGRRH